MRIAVTCLALTLSGCSAGSAKPAAEKQVEAKQPEAQSEKFSDKSIVDFAVTSYRKSLQLVAGNSIADNVTLEPDQETLRQFGDAKWKIAIISQLPREKIPPGTLPDRQFADSLNQVSVVTIEVKNGILVASDLDTKQKDTIERFPGTKAAIKAQEFLSREPIIE